jgi:type IV secretion system protein TrbL
VLTQTSFMSERAIGYVVSVGVKVMALALVVSIGTTIFNSYTVSTEPGIGEDVGLLLAAVLMVMLALKVPQIAAALISGGPQLSAGSAAMGAAGVAAGVAGTALAARAIGGAAGNVLGAVTGAGQVSSARSAAGALPSGRSGGGADSASGGSPTGGGPKAPSAPSLGGAASTIDPSSAGGASPGATSPPSPAETVASADARESGLTRAVGAAVIAGSQASDGGPGMTATPIRVSEPEA